MDKQSLEHLKMQYANTPIPPELEFTVKKALKKGGRKTFGKVRLLTAAAVIAAAFIAGINISPGIANALSEIPGVKNLVQILTFKEYRIDDGNFNANIVVPSIDGLENKALEKNLNAKYLEENKALYEQFMKDINEMKASGSEGHMGIDTGYVVKTDNDQILSVGRYVVNTVGSSSTTFKYDTIDKKNEILITLPSLFKDNSYVSVISENIKEQMVRQMKEDENQTITYWIGEGDYFEPFNAIAPDQSFYINEHGQLVISFDKYEVAPGYMGVVEFIIPAEVLSDILVSHQYIK